MHRCIANQRPTVTDLHKTWLLNITGSFITTTADTDQPIRKRHFYSRFK